MAELVRTKIRNSARRCDGLSSTGDHRLHRLRNLDNLLEDSIGVSCHPVLNVDKNPDCHEQNEDSKTGLRRIYHLQNQERRANYYTQYENVSSEYRRQYYVEHPEKKKAYPRGDYHRRYYLLNKDKKSDSWKKNKKATNVGNGKRRGGGTKEEYRREYKLRNNERNADYQNRRDSERAEYRRLYNLQNNEMQAEYVNRYEDSRQRYRQQYTIQNKEKSAEYRQNYNRNDDLRAENRRLYIGKKESLRVSSGSQLTKTYQSWRTPEIVRDFFDSLASPLNISNIVDWYRISRRQIDQHGGLTLYEKFGNLGGALQFAYPEIKWDLDVFSHRGKKSGQRMLKLKIKALLPEVEVIEDYQHPELNWANDSDRNIELDLWMPLHRVGIEYQGEQHYYNMNAFGPSNGAGSYSERDTLKNRLCESRGIDLIAIPYWWDGSVDSLSATLYQARPDVFPVSHAIPIPRDMPVFARVCATCLGISHLRRMESTSCQIRW